MCGLNFMYQRNLPKVIQAIDATINNSNKPSLQLISVSLNSKLWLIIF
jgi:hypothetical protein